MGSLPTLTIEAAPGYGPLSTVPGGAWVDLGTVNSATVQGSQRQRETDRFQGGRITAVLDATDGSNDPTNPSGDLEIGTPIRVRSVWSSTTYPVAYGFIDEVAPRWTQLTTDFADIVATDAFAYLAGLKVFDSGYPDLIASGSPTAHWPLDDQAISGIAADVTGGGNDMQRVSPLWSSAVYQPGASPILPLTVAPSTLLVDSGISCSASFFRLSSAYTVEVVYAYFPDADPFTQIITITTPSIYSGVTTGNGVFVGVANVAFFGFPAGQATLGNGTTTTSTTGLTLNDGRPHVLAVCRRGFNLELWVDGVLGCTVLDVPLTVGSELVLGGYFTSSVAVSQAAVWTSALSSATLLAHGQLGTRPWQGDTTGQRINRVLDLLGIPSSMRDIDPGKSIISAPLDDAFVQSPLAALDYLQRIAEAEGGRFFVGPDGHLVFHDRDRPFQSPYNTVQATYSDAVSPTGALPGGTFPYTTGGLKGSKSRAEVINQAVIARAPAPGDTDTPVTQVANDDASQTALSMVATLTQTAQLNPTDQECFNKGKAIVRQRSTPRFRAREITLDGRATDTLWPEILGRLVGDLIEIRRHPPSGIAYTDELRVEGKTLIYSKRQLTAKIVASAADTTQWMKIGDQFGGKLFW